MSTELLRGIKGAIPKAGKKKKSRTTAKGPKEDVIQSQVENYCAINDLECLHFPDSIIGYVYKFAPAPVKRLLSELRGYPDCMIFERGENPTRCLLLELKRAGRQKESNGGLHQSQRSWWRRMRIEPCVAYSFEEAKEMIDNFMEETKCEK